MRLPLAALLLIAAPALALRAHQSAPAATPQGPPPTPCLTAERNRQFDFWIGTWDVYPSAAPAGRSFNWYDTNLQTWRQLWIDQHGNTLDYTAGEYRDGAMRFSGWTRGPQGQRVEQRLIFFNIHRDTVRQLFEASSDSGRSWQPTFDARYVRSAGAP